MKTIRILLPLVFILTSLGVRATVLFEDSSNYPYANGCIEGQGQWYCYSPSTPYTNTYVTNNVLLLVTSSTNDAVATPTNGWVNPTGLDYAGFMLNVSQLPANADGNYFFQFQTNADKSDACHLFIQTAGTSVPGTYRLAIGNYDTSYNVLTPPTTFPEDLSTGVWYQVVVLYDISGDADSPNAWLWINPSEQDYQNFVQADGSFFYSGIPGLGDNYVGAQDTSGSASQLAMQPTQVGFSPYVNAGVSNVIVGTAFNDVYSKNLPAFGIQPQSGTNYSGNPAVFYAVASGVDISNQWYDENGPLANGPNYVGVNSNTLVVNSLSASDTYYDLVTDTYGNTLASSNATETVYTTPTAPFFPANVVAVTNNANLFTVAGFTNTALGTGPLYYQWYFAPTNTPTTFTPMSGQNSAGLSLSLVDYTYQGNYYVSVSNSVSGGSIAVGPTNKLVEVAPLIATMPQLHNLMISFTNLLNANKTGTTLISTNVSVSGYVTTFGGFGSTYSEFYIQDASGYAAQVYLQYESGHGSIQNTNTPPVGTYVNVTGELEVYHGELEMAPATIVPGGPTGMTTNTAAPVIPVGPVLANGIFNDLMTNDVGQNALLYDCALLTFTNVYIYNNTSGLYTNSVGLGLFNTNQATELYFTVGGPYSTNAPVNTNLMELYQYGYDYPEGSFGVHNTSAGATSSAFYNQPIPHYCYQLTGAWLDYNLTAGGELEPSRPADYVTNPPPAFAITASVSSKDAATLNWAPNLGSTYSTWISTNLLGPWSLAAQGLTYYPTNGAYTDTNKAPYKFYEISSP